MPDLEGELVVLGAALDVPADDFLATRVRAAIASAPRQRRRRLLILAAALLGIGVVSAPVVADLLRVGDVEVRREPPPTTASSGQRLDLGRRVSLAEARATVAFNIGLPAELGAPDEVWVDRAGPADVVWLAYRPGPDLPGAGATGYSVLLAMFDGSISQDVLATKFAEPDTTVEPVTIGSGRALWIEGAHFIALKTRSGLQTVDRLRLSDNVLLWERGDVTLRLESVLSRDANLRIARSVR